MSKEVEQIRKVVYAAIDELNGLLPGEKQLAKQADAILFHRSGFTKDGVLDSMDLVNLIVIVEEKLTSEFNINVDLSDERLFVDRIKELATVERLILWIHKRLNAS